MSSSRKHFGSSGDFLSEHRAQYPSSRTILVTGATAGIGLAITKYLLRAEAQHLLVLTGRNEEVLNDLRSKNPDRVVTSAGDMSDLDYVRAIIDGVQLDGKLDGLILNHGTLGSCQRIGEVEADEWEKTFRINVTSLVVLVQSGLPLLRAAKGRIVITSSGAASNAYSSWGAYGATKAAVNHLAMTLKNEEPELMSVSIRPGVVDTTMQDDIRSKYATNMDEKDQEKFMTAKRDGKLLPPEKPAHVIAELAVRATDELSGQFLSWDDPKLASYQSN